jgi:hypothetical protein
MVRMWRLAQEILVGLGFQEESGKNLYQIRCLMAETLEHLVNLVGRNKIMWVLRNIKTYIKRWIIILYYKLKQDDNDSNADSIWDM